MNLPSRIEFENGSRATYLYSADGTKLQVKYETSYAGLLASSPPSGSASTAIAQTHTIDYVGDKIYEDGVLSRMLIEGGYVDYSGETPIYHTYLTDHQGNVRVVVDENAAVKQVNHYYPYGALFAESTNGNVQPYKYNGKELDRIHDLDWYDHGARHNDAAIGRWHVMDPLCEKYYDVTPYAYCAGDPVNRVDNDGRKIDLTQLSEEEKMKYIDNIKYQNNSELFAKLYSELETSDDTYTIKISPLVSASGDGIDGRFIQSDDGGGIICFSNVDVLGKGTVLSEEFFHAYQYDNRPNYDIKAINLEFEAKIFTTLVGLQFGGSGIINEIDDFRNNIINNVYGNSLVGISPEKVVDKDFLSNYIISSNNFAKFNSFHNIGNSNYKTLTTINPINLQKIIQNTYKK